MIFYGEVVARRKVEVCKIKAVVFFDIPLAVSFDRAWYAIMFSVLDIGAIYLFMALGLIPKHWMAVLSSFK